MLIVSGIMCFIAMLIIEIVGRWIILGGEYEYFAARFVINLIVCFIPIVRWLLAIIEFGYVIKMALGENNG